MFNIAKEVQRLQQLKHAKASGLPRQTCPKNPPIYDVNLENINSCIFSEQAHQEGTAILRGFKNKSVDFGRRLSKVKGQKHYPGGGYAGHIVKGE